MDPTDVRMLIVQLADDLSKLEEHARYHRSAGLELGQLRLAAAIVRNSIGPFLNGQAATPLHLAVVGGAGTGKSTIVNFLIGTVAAEANPQAGYTRHPVAYVTGTEALSWCSQPGLLGKLQRQLTPSPSSLDQDIYQVRRIEQPIKPNRNTSPEPSPLPSSGDAAVAESLTLLEDVVVWDCPDMTTWAASNYVPRLLEVAGLADIVVYVASDERYNDEVPTQFLRLLLEAGKPVVIVLTKMRPAQADALLAHFRQEVLGRIAADNPKLPRMTALLAVPHLTVDELTDPTGRAARYRIPLINQIKVISEPPSAARKRVVRSGTNFLRTQRDTMLRSARADLQAIEGWHAAVQSGQDESINRFQREHLASKKYPRFDEALQRLLESLELPGPGKLLSGLFMVLRSPYSLACSLLTQIMSRPEGLQLPEREVLEAAFRTWMDQLRSSALRRADTHPIWQHINEGFERSLTDEAQEKFQEQLRAYERQVALEVDRVAQGVYLDLNKNPALLNTLRTLKVGSDALLSLVALLGFGGINEWDFVLVPLAAALSHQVFEWICRAYIIGKREQIRTRQLSLAAQYITAPVAEFLNKWPATGGSLFEQLQRVVKRLPTDIERLEQLVNAKLNQSPAPANSTGSTNSATSAGPTTPANSTSPAGSANSTNSTPTNAHRSGSGSLSQPS